MTITELSTPDDIFKTFVQADTWREVTQTFQSLCDSLHVLADSKNLFSHLKEHLKCSDAVTVFKALDKRAQQREYEKGEICAGKKVSKQNSLPKQP